MTSWWNDTAWPWLRVNWWKVLIFPVGLVLLLRALAPRRPPIPDVIVDPVREADRRAEEEATRRKIELKTESDALRARLDAIKAEHAEVMRRMNTAQQLRYEELRDDPEALNAWLLSLQSKH